MLRDGLVCHPLQVSIYLVIYPNLSNHHLFNRLHLGPSEWRSTVIRLKREEFNFQPNMEGWRIQIFVFPATNHEMFQQRNDLLRWLQRGSECAKTFQVVHILPPPTKIIIQVIIIIHFANIYWLHKLAMGWNLNQHQQSFQGGGRCLEMLWHLKI